MARSVSRVALPLALLALGGVLLVASGWRPRAERGVSSAASADAPAPSEPDDAVTLELGDLFVRPIGPRGLEISERVRALCGRRVRVRGYVVRQDEPMPGRFLLTERPLQLHEHEYGLADDLPAPTLLAIASTTDQPVLPSGPVVVVGTLEAGNREEPDGRVSTVRLVLDAPPRAVAADASRSTRMGEKS